MLKYSPEEYQSLNLSEKDSEQMKALSKKIEKVLDADAAKAVELLTKANQERIVYEAKKILYQTRDKQEDIVAEARYLANENIPPEPTLLKEKLNQTDEYFSDAWKGSWSEKFYKLIIEEIPDSGISIVSREEFPDKMINKNCVAIKATPYKTDRLFLCGLELNPVINLLTRPWFSKSLGKELEDKKILAPGTTERVLVKAYQEDIATLKAYIAKHGSDPQAEKSIVQSEEQLAKFGGVIPFSDKEAEDLMRKVIREEYQKKLSDEEGEDPIA